MMNVVDWYSAAVFTFDFVIACIASVTILGCNSAHGVCMTYCIAIDFAPTF